MTVTATGTYASTSSYLASVLGRTTSTTSGASASGSGSGTSGYSAATLVTLSTAAQAQLTAQQNASTDTVATNARAALDALYKAAKVTGPIVDGKTSVDLKSLDRRELYAVATNIGGKFSTDEQAIAQKELQARFDAVLEPQCAVARLTDDWSNVYKAALDYVDGAGAEEKASASYAATLAALQKGEKAALAQPDSVPSSSGDPVADFLKRAGDDGKTDGNERAFSDVATDVRRALDLQKQAAADNGLDFTFRTGRRAAQTVDWSGFDNRALSAIVLNQGQQFSAEEVSAAKGELDQRTRTKLLAAIQQAGSSSDPRAFSLGLLSSYQSMSAEERQAAHFSTDLRDQAVASYRETTSLISMLQQSSGGETSYFG
jgi:hypothetical protein